MTDLSKDPLVNVVHNGIKRDLRVAMENGCWRAAVILTFSGIDTMAYLGMPAEQLEVAPRDFIAWCERYIRFDGQEQLTGLDLYGARCGIVHAYGAISRTSRSGRCRHVVYRYRKDGAPVLFRPDVDPTLVIVSTEALVEAFFGGVDRFLVDLFRDADRAAAAERRFQGMYHLVPVP